jgi:hypothetical protein
MGNGEPVEPIVRRRAMPAGLICSRGCTSAFMHCAMYAALAPKKVAGPRSTNCHSAPMSGQAGLPS